MGNRDAGKAAGHKKLPGQQVAKKFLKAAGV